MNRLVLLTVAAPSSIASLSSYIPRDKAVHKPCMIQDNIATAWGHVTVHAYQRYAARVGAFLKSLLLLRVGIAGQSGTSTFGFKRKHVRRQVAGPAISAALHKLLKLDIVVAACGYGKKGTSSSLFITVQTANHPATGSGPLWSDVCMCSAP